MDQLVTGTVERDLLAQSLLQAEIYDLNLENIPEPLRNLQPTVQPWENEKEPTQPIVLVNASSRQIRQTILEGQPRKCR